VKSWPLRWEVWRIDGVCVIWFASFPRALCGRFLLFTAKHNPGRHLAAEGKVLFDQWFCRSRSGPARQVDLATAQEVQATAPYAYGIFSIVLDGKLLSFIYLGRDDLEKRVSAL
jgi:hypothetical protein